MPTSDPVHERTSIPKISSKDNYATPDCSFEQPSVLTSAAAAAARLGKDHHCATSYSCHQENKNVTLVVTKTSSLGSFFSARPSNWMDNQYVTNFRSMPSRVCPQKLHTVTQLPPARPWKPRRLVLTIWTVKGSCEDGARGSMHSRNKQLNMKAEKVKTLRTLSAEPPP